MSALIDFLGAAALGALVGIGELVARYRDAPGRVLGMPPAILYFVINAVASCTGLGLIRAYGWSLPAPFASASSPGTDRWTQVLVAGFGAMALFTGHWTIAPWKGLEKFYFGPAPRRALSQGLNPVHGASTS